jgi:hypothetical protein
MNGRAFQVGDTARLIRTNAKFRVYCGRIVKIERILEDGDCAFIVDGTAYKVAPDALLPVYPAEPWTITIWAACLWRPKR